MKSKTPAALGGRGVDMLAGVRAPITIMALRTQFIAGRCAVSPELAAIVASLIFGGERHG